MTSELKNCMGPDGQLLPSMPCTKCKGAGTMFSKGFTYEGQNYPDKTEKCYSCNGRGTYPAPVVKDILGVIILKGQLRKSAPSFPQRKADLWRSYYVWRLARFHGGADVCMPMTASLMSDGDPYRPFLDYLAEEVAKRAFGTDMVATYRWGHALGHIATVPEGQPASAYTGGPVCDDNKPVEEQYELI